MTSPLERLFCGHSILSVFHHPGIGIVRIIYRDFSSGARKSAIFMDDASLAFANHLHELSILTGLRTKFE